MTNWPVICQFPRDPSQCPKRHRRLLTDTGIRSRVKHGMAQGPSPNGCVTH
jgi:hypothetical protein